MSTVQLDDPVTGAPAPQEGIGGAARVTGAAVSLQAVTPSDSNPLPAGCKALWIGGAGAVAVKAIGDGAAQTFLAVPAGTKLDVAARFVMATGTTATNIVAMF